MKKLLQTDLASCLQFDQTDVVPPGIGQGDIGILPIGHRDAFLTLAELKKLRYLAEPDPEPAELEGHGDGYVTVIDTVFQGKVVAGSEEGRPAVYKTARDAWLSVVDITEDHIDQFKKGEREFDQIDFLTEWNVVPVTVLKGGTITCSDGVIWPKAADES